MRHAITGRKFSRKPSHRKSLILNLSKSLIEHESIKTTTPKAKDLKRVIDKIVTTGKKGTLAARRELIAKLGSRDLASKVIDTLSPRYQNREGGYSRVIKCGFRHGDSAPMAVIELVDRPNTEGASGAVDAG